MQAFRLCTEVTLWLIKHLSSGILNFILFYFMYMNVLPAHIYGHHVHAWCPQRSKEGVRSPGSNGYEPPCGYKEPTSGSLPEQQVLSSRALGNALKHPQSDRENDRLGICSGLIILFFIFSVSHLPSLT